MTRARLLPFLVVALLAACDSSDPDPRSVSPTDVVGTYSFTIFAFEPNASRIDAVNLLDTLETSETKLHLFEDRTFILTYRLRGGFTVPVRGEFSVGEQEIRLEGSTTDAQGLTGMLLNGVATLNRDPGDRNLLVSTRSNQSVNLGTFMKGYEDTSVLGTIRIQLRR